MVGVVGRVVVGVAVALGRFCIVGSETGGRRPVPSQDNWEGTEDAVSSRSWSCSVGTFYINNRTLTNTNIGPRY